MVANTGPPVVFDSSGRASGAQLLSRLTRMPCRSNTAQATCSVFPEARRSSGADGPARGRFARLGRVGRGIRRVCGPRHRTLRGGPGRIRGRRIQLEAPQRQGCSKSQPPADGRPHDSSRKTNPLPRTVWTSGPPAFSSALRRLAKVTSMTLVSGWSGSSQHPARACLG